MGAILTRPMQRLLTHVQSRPEWPGHAAFAFSGIAFLVSDMLLLRVLAVTSCTCAILFNTYHPVGKALWLPIRWNIFYVGVNRYASP